MNGNGALLCVPWCVDRISADARREAGSGRQDCGYQRSICHRNGKIGENRAFGATQTTIFTKLPFVLKWAPLTNLDGEGVCVLSVL